MQTRRTSLQRLPRARTSESRERLQIATHCPTSDGVWDSERPSGTQCEIHWLPISAKSDRSDKATLCSAPFFPRALLCLPGRLPTSCSDALVTDRRGLRRQKRLLLAAAKGAGETLG